MTASNVPTTSKAGITDQTTDTNTRLTVIIVRTVLILLIRLSTAYTHVHWKRDAFGVMHISFTGYKHSNISVDYSL